jgi:hypothetical protein
MSTVHVIITNYRILNFLMLTAFLINAIQQQLFLTASKPAANSKNWYSGKNIGCVSSVAATSHYRDLDSILEQSMWDLWWTYW